MECPKAARKSRRHQNSLPAGNWENPTSWSKCPQPIMCPLMARIFIEIWRFLSDLPRTNGLVLLICDPLLALSCITSCTLQIRMARFMNGLNKARNQVLMECAQEALRFNSAVGLSADNRNSFRMDLP